MNCDPAARCGVMIALSLLLPLAPAGATRSDADKERRWAEQVVESLLDGDELWLRDPSGHRFFNVLTEGEQRDRAAVLVHGIGVHPNWPDVIYPLRAGLYEDGLTTLSVQMSVLARARPAGVSSVILIGMSPGSDDRNIDNLAKIAVPVLDLYGEQDLEPVVGSAGRRAAAAAEQYRQSVGAGADHFWRGEETLLLEMVRDWLRSD